jgi:hypothetical protein
MRKFILLVLAAWVANAQGQMKETPIEMISVDIKRYICDGTNPDGRNYKSILTIYSSHQYQQFIWNLIPTSNQVTGTSVIDGDHIAVAYGNGPADLGVVLYQVAIENNAEVLNGRWTTGDGQVATERCVFERRKIVQIPFDPRVQPEVQKEESPKRQRGSRGATEI